MKNKDNSFFLPLIVALAFTLRIIGVSHGFPFIFHPDEPAVIRTALSMRFFPNPGHFDWPHLFMYLNYFVYLFFDQFRRLVEVLGFKSALSAVFPLMWNDSLVFYILSRTLAALFGSLTVIPLYLIGRDNFGKRVGIIAALALAVTPFHVWNSHYALIDVPMLFFASWGVFFALNILKRRDPNDYSGAGFYTGLATSTKYNGALTGITIPLAHLMRVFTDKEKILNKKSLLNLVLAAGTTVIGFLLGTPYALLDYQTFVRTDGPKGALWQFTNVGSLPLAQRIPEIYNNLVYKIPDDFGYTIIIGFWLVGVLLLFRTIRKKHRLEDPALALLFVVGLLMMLYISGVMHSRSQYYLVVYPYVIVCFAYVMDIMLQQMSFNNALIGFLLFVLGLGIPSFMSLKDAFIFQRSDTRAALYNWIKATQSSKDVIYYNNNNLTVLVDALPNPKTKLVPNYIPTFPGLVLVSQNTDGSIDNFQLEKYPINVKRIATVDNYLRLGPKIQIYSVNK